MSEIDIFAFELDVRQWSALEKVLAPEEVERASRFRFERDRRRYIVGRAQLRSIVGRYVGREPRELQFTYGAHGKPRLNLAGARLEIDVNLTRSHELGMVAIQREAEVGIDVERVRPFPECLDIARRFFAPEEYTTLASLPAFEREDAFFRLWTQKEAIVKSLGLGLSHSIDVPIDRWVTQLAPPAPGYVAAIASAVPPTLIRNRTWPQ